MLYKNYIQRSLSDVKETYFSIRRISGYKSLCLKYKNYNPLVKSFLPFIYIQVPLLQLLVILSVSYSIYIAIVHFSSGALSSTLIGIMCWSLYISLAHIFFNALRRLKYLTVSYRELALS